MKKLLKNKLINLKDYIKDMPLNIKISTLFFIFFIFLSILVLVPTAKADDISSYFETNDSLEKLDKDERRVLEIYEKWSKGNQVSPISIGENGEIEMIYGLKQTHISTAILQVTDIQFELGETIIAVHIGDTTRWVVEHIKSNTYQGVKHHLIIKPKAAGLSTSLVVISDRRTYHLTLKSNQYKYYPMVKFHYPKSIIIKNNLLKDEDQEVASNGNDILSQAYGAHKNNDIAKYLRDLDFRYEIKGKAAFKPIRVYNDKMKTMIELPKEIQHKNIPTLMLIEPESKKPVIVNYRFKNNKFIVDAVFDKAILISGVGYKQKKITIIHRGE